MKPRSTIAVPTTDSRQPEPGIVPWTNAGGYLIAVHVQTPTGAKADDAAVALLTDDVETRIT